MEMDWEKRNEEALKKRLKKLCNIANKNLVGKQAAKRLFPGVELNKVPLRLSMLDRACLKSLVVSSTPMTCKKKKPFTPDSSQSVSPIEEIASRKQSKTSQPVILPPDPHESEGEGLIKAITISSSTDNSPNPINEGEQCFESRSNKKRPESKSQNLNSIISKLSSAQMVSAGMQVSNSNLHTTDKTVQTSVNNVKRVKRIRGTKKLARSICSGKERQTQTGVSLVGNIEDSPASVSSSSSNSSVTVQILHGAEKAALWSHQCDLRQHKLNNEVNDSFEPDVPGPWRAASGLQEPVEQNPNSLVPIFDSMEDDVFDDDTFLPKPAAEKKVYPNKKKTGGKMAVKETFNATREKVHTKSRGGNIDSKKKVGQNEKSIQKSPFRAQSDFHAGDSRSFVDHSLNHSIEDNREINTKDSYKKQKNTKKKKKRLTSDNSRQDIANFTLDVQNANTKNDLDKSKERPSCKKTITNKKNRGKLNQLLSAQDLALHQSEQFERLKSNNKINPKQMQEKFDKKNVGTSDSSKIIADTDLPKSKCIESTKLRKNGLSKIHDSMTPKTAAAQDDSRQDIANFTLDVQNASTKNDLDKSKERSSCKKTITNKKNRGKLNQFMSAQDLALHQSEQFERLKSNNKISPKRMQEKSDKKSVGISDSSKVIADTDLPKSQCIESAKLRKNGLSKIHDSLEAKTVAAQDVLYLLLEENILEDFPQNDQSVASERHQNEVSLRCSVRIQRQHEKEMQQSNSILDPENNRKTRKGNKNHSNASLENTKCDEEVHPAANISQRLRSADKVIPLNTTGTSQKPGEDLLTDLESNHKTPQRDQNHTNRSLQNTKCSEVHSATDTPQRTLPGKKRRSMKTTDTSEKPKENLLNETVLDQENNNKTPQADQNHINHSLQNTQCCEVLTDTPQTARSAKKVSTMKTTNTSKTPTQGLLNGLVQNTQNKLSDDIFKVPLDIHQTLNKKKPRRRTRTENTSDEVFDTISESHQPVKKKTARKGQTSRNVTSEICNDHSNEESQTLRRSSRVRRQARIVAAGFFIQKAVTKAVLKNEDKTNSSIQWSNLEKRSVKNQSSRIHTTAPSVSTSTVNNFGPIVETENETNMNISELEFSENSVPPIEHEDPITSNEASTRVITNESLEKTGKIKPTIQEEEPRTSNKASTRVTTNEHLVMTGKIKKRHNSKLKDKKISNSLKNTLNENCLEEMNEILNICDNGKFRRVRWAFKNQGFKEINGLSGVSTSSFDGACTGVLKIKAGFEKPRHVTNKYSLSFAVVEGHADVAVQDKSDVFKPDDTFIIPAGCEYSIKNAQKKRQLKLVFTRIPE